MIRGERVAVEEACVPYDERGRMDDRMSEHNKCSLAIYIYLVIFAL